MSAVKDYRRVTADDGSAEGRDWDAVIPAADAAIAEMEADRARKAEAISDLVDRAEQAEVERDALRDRRCEKCAKWAGADDKFHGCPVEYDRDADNTDGDPPDDFACNRWAKGITP